MGEPTNNLIDIGHKGLEWLVVEFEGKAAQNALRKHDLPAESLGVFPAWTDAALISREAKIPSIIWGPGELNYAHSPEENIRLEDVILAKNLYASAALSFTGSLQKQSKIKNA